MKKAVTIIAVLLLTCMTAACGKATKIVHCDRCNAEIKVEASSNVDESWTLYCEECDKEMGLTDKITEEITN